MKIADITPGLYVHQKRKGPAQTMLVLSGDALYGSMAGPTYLASRVTRKVYQAHGMAGVLCAYVPFYRGRLRHDLSDSSNLQQLVDKVDELRELATTVSLEAASDRANEIADLGWDAVRVTTDINPFYLSPAPSVLPERNPDVRLRDALNALRSHDLEATWQADGIHLRLSVDEAERLATTLKEARRDLT